MFVYAMSVVKGRDRGPHKVGITGNLQKRLNEAQSCNHEKLEISYSRELNGISARAVENHVHWILAERNLLGEWFAATRDDVERAIGEAIVAVKSGKVLKPFRKTGGGRKKVWGDSMVAKFNKGTLVTISGLLAPGEYRTDFVRLAVDREIARRLPSLR